MNKAELAQTLCSTNSIRWDVRAERAINLQTSCIAAYRSLVPLIHDADLIDEVGHFGEFFSHPSTLKK